MMFVENSYPFKLKRFKNVIPCKQRYYCKTNNLRLVKKLTELCTTQRFGIYFTKFCHIDKLYYFRTYLMKLHFNIVLPSMSQKHSLYSDQIKALYLFLLYIPPLRSSVVTDRCKNNRGRMQIMNHILMLVVPCMMNIQTTQKTKLHALVYFHSDAFRSKEDHLQGVFIVE